MQTIEAGEVDDAIINMRFRHYQNRLMDRVNRVLRGRKQIKMRWATRDEMQSMFSHT